MTSQILLKICRTNEDFQEAMAITTDYIQWLGMDLSFQDIDHEYKVFANMYGYPHGCFIIAKYHNMFAGGVGIRILKDKICEMKRLFVYDKYRGKGIGLSLCRNIIKVSKELGYTKMRLDSIERLKKASELYSYIGFHYIPKYRENPDESAIYMELDLI